MKGFSLQDYLKDLETVVNIDSGHYYEPGANAVASFFMEKYDALGLNTEITYKDGNKACPFLTATNTDEDHYDVLLVGHMDTVFAPGTAAERPFSIDEAGHGRGPGVIDCKGGDVALYYLIKGMLEAGEIGFSFCIAMNSDEERRSDYSRDRFDMLSKRSDCCFIFEPGRANGEFVSLRKGGANYLVHCKGIPAHSGVCPEKGASAVLELSKWVQRLYERFFILEEGTTINIGRFDGGADNGSVPEYAEFTISLRCMTMKRFLEIDEEIMDMENRPFDPRCKITVDKLVVRPPMCPDEKTNAIIAVMEEAGRELGQPVVMLSTGGGSDGNFIAHNDCPTVDACGPCGTFVHTPDEYLDIDSVEPRLDIMRLTLLKLFPQK